MSHSLLLLYSLLHAHNPIPFLFLFYFIYFFCQKNTNVTRCLVWTTHALHLIYLSSSSLLHTRTDNHSITPCNSLPDRLDLISGGYNITKTIRIPHIDVLISHKHVLHDWGAPLTTVFHFTFLFVQGDKALFACLPLHWQPHFSSDRMDI